MVPVRPKQVGANKQLAVLVDDENDADDFDALGLPLVLPLTVL